MITRIGKIPDHAIAPGPAGGLGKLNLLLEATMLLHSQLPLDSVLDTMLDHAIAITDADRGLLARGGSIGSASPSPRARRTGSVSLPPESFSPSQTALRMALERQSGVITEDLAQADAALQGAESIVAQRLRAVVAIPLYAMPRANTAESIVHIKRGHFLGVLYLDSRRPAAFSKLDRQILDALAVEAASILDNARLVERERQRQRLEQELSIARDIQQALLPRGFRDFPHLAVTGINFPCLAVGGDYFDVFPMSERPHRVPDRRRFRQRTRRGAAHHHAAGRALRHDHRRRSRARSSSTSMLSCAITPKSAATPRCSSAFSTATAISNISTPAILRRSSAPRRSHRAFTRKAPFRSVCFRKRATRRRVTCSSRNDTLILFSDGITEAVDLQEEMYGIDRLRALFAGQANPGLDYLQQTALASLREFARGASQADDITLLLVRYQPTNGDPAPSAA